eukprot:TRINITY_DN2107_c0_g1_i3.p2 TRINITY_DN2107_c0_g1~~TRINITY_DN2107_c0_g1_i3.p2  ORF type:complete len:103 (+),score=6.05 TRINITY_DN2107_c0_g1_i3:340-648(+)
MRTAQASLPHDGGGRAASLCCPQQCSVECPQAPGHRLRFHSKSEYACGLSHPNGGTIIMRNVTATHTARTACHVSMRTISTMGPNIETCENSQGESRRVLMS